MTSEQSSVHAPGARAGSDAALLARLEKLDSCALSDALDRVGQAGVVVGLHPYGAVRRICGRAVTVLLEPVTEEVQARLAARGEPPRHLGTAAVDASGRGDVIVVAHRLLDVSGWGGILSRGAQRNGVEGVLVDGACRDVDEARELDFAVYARAAVPTTARGRIVETDWNVPVTFGDMRVMPGDLVLADGSGAVFLAAERAEQVIGIAEEIVAREQAMAGAVSQGKPLAEVMGATYERMLRG